ncbi:MAG: TetR family transcriptional regulator [Planctomycetes bacterium]|nr:TetR family transcriptional regulator [Planctomycetota bacterium]
MPAPRSPEIRDTYDERLNRILEAATSLIASEGYGNASMRAVARVAGVSLAGLYHYFDSKEKMLFLIQFRTFSSLLARLRENLHGVADPVEQLRVLVRTHVAHFAHDMAALNVCSHELDSLREDAYDEVFRVRHEYYDLARGIVDRILERHGGGRNFDGHIAVMSLFGTLNWLYRWYDPKQGRSVGTVANQITEQFLTGILGRAPAARPEPAAGG